MRLSTCFATVLAAVASTAVVSAAVAPYNLDITYVDNVNADGVSSRRVIGVNNKWPPPLVVADYNETITVNVKNSLDVPTSMHSHGLFFKGENYLDGPSGITQCGIPPGGTYKYEYVPKQWGTYWYHAHNGGQYVDGFRGPLIIRNPNEPYKYDFEYIVILHDWYHNQFDDILKDYAGVYNPTGSEPPPDNVIILIHDGTDYIEKMKFLPGKTYRLRIINMSAFTMYHFSIGGHSMDVIEVDGDDTERKTTNGFWVSVAQRWSVLVTAKNATDKNYPVNLIVDDSMFAIIPPTLKLNYTTTIEYSPTATLDETPAPYEELDDIELSPIIKEASTPANQTITLDVLLDLLDDGINHGSFNGITWTRPQVPTIFTALSAGPDATNPDIYGKRTNAIIIEHMSMVQVIINNNDGGSHPFHLHGHKFQIMGRSTEFYDPSKPYPELDNPIRRDVVQVPAMGSAVIRFRADNPGVWLFHCHIQWHMETGLAATFIEAPLEMQKTVKPPAFVFDQCKSQNIATSGNALGKLGTDMEGEELGPQPLSGTWEKKGKIALAFTILSALLGLGTVVWFAST
ncbi:hypothetical protein PhCBS80983_g00268 [Powellomyces hirtus]|uniref:Ferroxidase n=1 Tax=Powellomyces hirtus TaxID=109895 RepID=A0A507EFU1_9FUNG|nr:hypothetical protein PhCBS80983_g00268 [Powellomyces hirtus]